MSAANPGRPEESGQAPRARRARSRARRLLFAVGLATAPWPFIGQEPSLLLGVPLWLWWSGGMTFLLSAATAWTIVRHWPDDDELSGS